MAGAKRLGVRRPSAAFAGRRASGCGSKRQRTGALQNLAAVAGLFLLSAFCFRAWGQYSIDWSTIDGGGGTSTGGVYQVSGTIGQPDAGKMSGGNYTIDGGFWGLIAAVQTPGAPLLTITRSDNSVIVSWPSPSTGFSLQQNGNVANTNGWSVYGGTISNNGTIKSVTLNPPTGNWFHWLKKQTRGNAYGSRPRNVEALTRLEMPVIIGLVKFPM
jgi:hypothetical protein